jgi:hypothetical protein
LALIIQAAETSKDLEKEAAVCHKIGNIQVKKKDYEKALYYQNKNLLINRPDDVSIILLNNSSERKRQ